jgi:hypothetical protein
VEKVIAAGAAVTKEPGYSFKVSSLKPDAE